ncbi:hypothetical protein G7Y89_g8886 [Cudoniella acicularis]|uniref:Uncharacterized protein n=1 Tax=Cudoniella acicularis TaxID=354080 RepID=A0A8H4RIJ6_9HELO|nr:hypothetical protein G7Y89_g8886 [Cudoniella acicularis]
MEAAACLENYLEAFRDDAASVSDETHHKYADHQVLCNSHWGSLPAESAMRPSIAEWADMVSKLPPRTYRDKFPRSVVLRCSLGITMASNAHNTADIPPTTTLTTYYPRNSLETSNDIYYILFNIPFLDNLPDKIRLKIQQQVSTRDSYQNYGYLLPNPDLTTCSTIQEGDNFGANAAYGLFPNILQTCWQIYHEASQVLYYRNTFAMSFAYDPHGWGSDENHQNLSPVAIYGFQKGITAIQKVRKWKVIMSADLNILDTLHNRLEIPDTFLQLRRANGDGTVPDLMSNLEDKVILVSELQRLVTSPEPAEFIFEMQNSLATYVLACERSYPLNILLELQIITFRSLKFPTKDARTAVYTMCLGITNIMEFFRARKALYKWDVLHAPGCDLDIERPAPLLDEMIDWDVDEPLFRGVADSDTDNDHHQSATQIATTSNGHPSHVMGAT